MEKQGEKFFVNENEREASGHTCYLSFIKGHFNNKYGWFPDAMNITEDNWMVANIEYLIEKVIKKEFDYYGINEISREQWDEIVEKSETDRYASKEAIDEIKPWVEECFKEYNAFYIQGL